MPSAAGRKPAHPISKARRAIAGLFFFPHKTLAVQPAPIPQFMAADTKTHQEHPLANILINVLIPVFALGALSKDPSGR